MALFFETLQKVSIYCSSTRLYSKQFSWWPKLDGPTFNSVDDDEALSLERIFKESDVQEVVKVLNDDK